MNKWKACQLCLDLMLHKLAEPPFDLMGRCRNILCSAVCTRLFVILMDTDAVLMLIWQMSMAGAKPNQGPLQYTVEDVIHCKALKVWEPVWNSMGREQSINMLVHLHPATTLNRTSSWDVAYWCHMHDDICMNIFWSQHIYTESISGLP